MRCPEPLSFELLTFQARAERKPMFVFAFDRGLLPFRLNTPAFDVLFQLPPRYARRSIFYGASPAVLISGFDPLAEKSADLVDLFRPLLVHTCGNKPRLWRYRYVDVGPKNFELCVDL